MLSQPAYYLFITKDGTSANAQWATAFASQAEGLGDRVPAATDLFLKTGIDSSTTKRSASGVSVTGPRQ